MNLLRASAALLLASRRSAASSSDPDDAPATRRKLVQNFNYEVIPDETSLSTRSTSRPATFSATFTNRWTGVRHPFRYPAGRAHWSSVVFASHNEGYTMWCDECIATEGVEDIAETGSPGTLEGELMDYQDMNVVLDQSTAGPSNTPVGAFEDQSIDGTLCFDEMHPLASAITMIAPSPDWFSGLYNLPMYEEDSSGNDVWYDKFTAYVFAWDAGTEDGETFSINNSGTDPFEPMVPFMAGTELNALFVSEGDGDGVCRTQEECDQRRMELGFSRLNVGNYPSRGCFSKRNRAYWSDGTDEEIAREDLPGVQERISCGGLRVLPVGIVTFELQGGSAACTARSNEASPADAEGSFDVRRKGAFVTTNCEEWATTRTRCRRRVFADGSSSGQRVRDLCPASCMAYQV